MRFDIAFRFVECINRLDLVGLSDLMTDDHKFVDLAGDSLIGREAMKEAWREYMSRFPDYMIHISEVFEIDNEVVLVGRTTGSHLQIPRSEEFAGGTLIWVAIIEDDKIAEWRLYYDTPANRETLKMAEANRVA